MGYKQLVGRSNLLGRDTLEFAQVLHLFCYQIHTTASESRTISFIHRRVATSSFGERIEWRADNLYRHNNTRLVSSQIGHLCLIHG